MRKKLSEKRRLHEFAIEFHDNSKLYFLSCNRVYLLSRRLYTKCLSWLQVTTTVTRLQQTTTEKIIFPYCQFDGWELVNRSDDMSTKWLSSKNNFCCSRNKFARISTVCNMKVTISETSPNKNVSILCPNLSVSKRWKYFRRIFKYRQMDFEFALWQMLYLFISPSKV